MPDSTLWAAVKVRVPARRLIELTNRDSQNATSIDDTVGEQATTDAQGMFSTYAGSSFDTALNEHLRVGVDGVVALLRYWASGDEAFRDKWKEEAREYGLTAGRDHKSLATASPLTPTDESDVDPVVGWSDPAAFDGYAPKMP